MTLTLIAATILLSGAAHASGPNQLQKHFVEDIVALTFAKHTCGILVNVKAVDQDARKLGLRNGSDILRAFPEYSNKVIAKMVHLTEAAKLNADVRQAMCDGIIERLKLDPAFGKWRMQNDVD